MTTKRHRHAVGTAPIKTISAIQRNHARAVVTMMEMKAASAKILAACKRVETAAEEADEILAEATRLMRASGLIE